MFYTVDNGLHEIDFSQLTDDVLQVGLVNLQQLKEIYQKLGFSETDVELCHHCDMHQRNNLAVYDKYSFCHLSLIEKQQDVQWCNGISFFIKQNFFLVVVNEHDTPNKTEDIQEIFKKSAVVKDITLEKLIYMFFIHLILVHNDVVDGLGQQIQALEKNVLDDKLEQFNLVFLTLRRQLLHLHSYYEQLLTLGEDLLADENDLFEDINLRYLKIFTDRVARLSNNVRLLRDSASQVRESYQAQMDISLNKTMKIFTVVTTVFLPLTLITGWYGMNFVHMPELHWLHAYPLVFLFCVVVVIGGLMLCKKNKML